jgi:hypothetical protein
MDREIYEYIKNGITITGNPDDGYTIFTIPTQHFKIDNLDELTAWTFENEIRKQKEHDELTSEIFKEVQKEIDQEILNQLRGDEPNPDIIPMWSQIDDLYSNYEQNWMKENPPFSAPHYEVCYTKWEFIDKLLFDDDFYKEWGEDCCEELTYEERYKIWFGNNYETGMEYNLDIEPDWDNEYYEPTPKRKLKWN